LLYLKRHLMETPALLNINFHSNQAFHLYIGFLDFNSLRIIKNLNFYFQ
jgi:hypothetical protein